MQTTKKTHEREERLMGHSKHYAVEGQQHRQGQTPPQAHQAPTMAIGQQLNPRPGEF